MNILRSLPLTVLGVCFAWGCGASPTAPSPNTPMTPDIPTTAARFFGVVMNEEGAPLAGARVEVVYAPDSGPAQGASTLAASDGRYELQLNARQPGNVNVLVRVTANGDYLVNEQLVRLAAETALNVRLRRVRTISVGQSTTITFDAGSSRCTMPGTTGICEQVRIQFPNVWRERLVVSVNAEADGVVPMLLTNYWFPPISGQGTVSLPIGEDEFWNPTVPRFVDVTVAIPSATTSQRYAVTLQAP